MWRNGVITQTPVQSPHPSLTLSYVLGLASARDRIVVGPGEYEENGLEITQSGLKLESTAGRHATTIRSIDGDHALQVTAEKVHIWQERALLLSAGPIMEKPGYTSM